MNIQPIGERVVVKPLRKETEKRVQLVHQDDSNSHLGTIAWIAEDSDIALRQGDTILFNEYEEEVTIQGQRHFIVNSENILIKIE